MIKNLTPSLPECGKIKIGFKGKEITSKQGKKFQPPKKQDYFTITTLERGDDGNFLRNKEIHQAIGEQPKEIDVRLLYDDPDLNFFTRYVCYDGTTLWCTGDGEKASRILKRGETDKQNERKQTACPCERLESGFTGKGKCKPSGVLSVMLDNSPIVGGVWKLRTTSFNSVTNILSSLAMISRISGGVLAGLPLKLTFSKKTTTIPNTDKKTTIPVIGLIYKGSVNELAAAGAKTALEFASHRKRIEYIEDIARKGIEKEIGVYTADETDEDIVAEFYPEQVGVTGSAAAETETRETRSFVDLINESISDSNLLPLVDKFVTASAKALSKTADEVKLMAIENFPDFLNQFNGWVKKNATEEKKNIINTLEKGDLHTHKVWFDPNHPANAGMKKEESAAPGETKPGKEPETPKTEDVISGAEAKEKGQGPQPSAAWSPYNSEIQQRYPADKAAIIKAECEKIGITITGLVPREAHGLLLDSVKAEMEADTEQEEEDQTAYEVENPEADEPEQEPVTEQEAAHKRMLAEKEAKRKAMYGEKPEPTEPEWSEDDPKPPDAIRADCIRTLQNVADIDRGVWMKTKQQVGIMTTPRLDNMPIDKLVEWATLARATVERDKDIKF